MANKKQLFLPYQGEKRCCCAGLENQGKLIFAPSFKE
jgi:hypothetical protein